MLCPVWSRGWAFKYCVEQQGQKRLRTTAECYLSENKLKYNPNSKKLGHFENAIKSRICDLFILFNFYLIDKNTNKRFPKFSLTNVNVFCKYEHILIFMAATDSKKVGTEVCLTLCHINLSFNYNVSLFGN